MTTHSRISDLTLQPSGRLAPAETAPTGRPKARRRAMHMMLQKIAIFAVATALSGSAPNVAAARGGGGGGGHGGGGIGSDFVAGSGGGFGGGHFGGFGGSPVGGFGGTHVGEFGGTRIGGFAGSPVVGFGGSFGSHLGGLSGGGFHNAPLAINTGRFTSPSALVGQHTAAAGARLNMHYRPHHGRRYYANDCFIAANDPYSCQPYSSCPCSTLP